MLVALALGSTVGLEAEPAAAAPVGCGYANSTPNNGKFASTICWFDFTAFDLTQARSAAGQAMQVTLDGGFVATFTVRFANVISTMNVERRATPLETRFAFGTDAYRGIPGLHSLYSLAAPAGTKSGRLSFENIRIVDGLGAPVTGFSFVAADTEDNVSGESFAWSSDKALTEIERLAPAGNWGCKAPVGLGTTDVSCAGTGVGATTIAGGKSTALLVAADSPTRFSTQWTTGARSGIAIGIQTAKITVIKQVANRIAPEDAFDVSVAATGGSAIATASTGVANTATTGTVNVLAGGSFTLSDGVTAGSPANLANYATAWTCTNASTTSTTVLPSGAGTSKSVTPVAGDDITCTVTNTGLPYAISLEKHAGSPTDVNGNGITDIGDTIPYSFTVTNSGDATLENIAVDDPKVGAVTCPAGPLSSGASALCTAAAPYVVTAADSSAGAVNNSATAAGSPLGASIVAFSAPSTTSTPVEVPAPGLTIIKSATPSDAAAYTVGQAITYSFVVTNSGNITVADVDVVDSAFSGSGALSEISCPTATLLSGEQVVCTATYSLTQADVNSGTLSNTAIATGDPVAWPDTVTSDPSSFAIPVDAAPGLSLLKTVSPTTTGLPGDTVQYSFAVTNTGNVSLSGAVVTETAFSGSGAAPEPVCPSSPFLPGETVTCIADYTLTQADVNAGTVTNTATASALAPDRSEPVSEPSSATVTIAPDAELALLKTASVDGDAVAGDTVTYEFLVANAGNVTIADVAIDETVFSGTGTVGPISCGATTLDSGEDTTCTATYQLTQQDVDAGRVDNTAVATGEPAGPASGVQSEPSSAEVVTTRIAALSLVKTVDRESARPGETIAYTYLVTNTGTVSVTALAIVETEFTGSGPVPVVACPDGVLLPGEQHSCSATYVITTADVSAAAVANTAVATASAPGDILDPVSDASTALLSIGPAPQPLAFTGSTVALTGAGLCALLLAAGAGLLVARRRRA